MKFTFSQWLAERFTRSTRDKLDHGIPTIEFDRQLVTKAVRNDLWKNVQAISDIPKRFHKRLYKVALKAILQGRSSHLIYNDILSMRINSMTETRAAAIAHLLCNKATSFINAARQISMGLPYAIWIYSGAPCEIDPLHPIGQDNAHKAANGKQFEVRTGLFINGKYTWPGSDEGCRCISRAVIPGFS